MVNVHDCTMLCSQTYSDTTIGKVWEPSGRWLALPLTCLNVITKGFSRLGTESSYESSRGLPGKGMTWEASMTGLGMVHMRLLVGRCEDWVTVQPHQCKQRHCRWRRARDTTITLTGACGIQEATAFTESIVQGNIHSWVGKGQIWEGTNRRQQNGETWVIYDR